MTEHKEERQYIECRSYTHARKHPWVIGVIGGWRLPSPLTPTQLVVLLGSFVVLYNTRHAWGHFGVFNLVILVVIPFALSWIVRHIKVEGRSPIKMLIGYLTYALTPPKGVVRGRPNRDGRKSKLNSTIVIAELPTRKPRTPIDKRAA